MRQIVKTLPPTSEITVAQLRSESFDGCLIAAYRSYNSDAYCVLTQLQKNNYKAGFIPLNGASNPRYVADNCYESIEAASKCRKVFLFSSMDEMLKAMVNKDF